MDKREAKRRVCETVAHHLIEQMAHGEVGSHLDDADDRERWLEATQDLADELLRRAGIVRTSQHWVDPRQLDLGLDDVRLEIDDGRGLERVGA